MGLIMMIVSVCGPPIQAQGFPVKMDPGQHRERDDEGEGSFV
jgi:hypothetical protein